MIVATDKNMNWQLRREGAQLYLEIFRTCLCTQSRSSSIVEQRADYTLPWTVVHYPRERLFPSIQALAVRAFRTQRDLRYGYIVLSAVDLARLWLEGVVQERDLRQAGGMFGTSIIFDTIRIAGTLRKLVVLEPSSLENRAKSDHFTGTPVAYSDGHVLLGRG